MELSLDELRALTGWAASCASRVLPLYETRVPDDPRPRAAISAAQEFAAGAPRTKLLRTVAWAALSAAGETSDPAASAAARAAVGAAGAAYLHPLASPHQVKHIVGPAQQAALARELAGGSAEAELEWALTQAPPEVSTLLHRFPPGKPGKTRLGELHRLLETALRAPRDGNHP
ncbi:putative immunity protein [Amycolatopsis sp. NPDC024027]|uniref:putative immunity protein n=1 Tax=Amycolatopsis sp. NPDC024027 TaxID=3154327 RepID=UPI0033FE50D1